MRSCLSLVTFLLSLSSTAHSATILETAKGAGTFTSLVAALEVANLAQTMNRAGSYTVFAPTDEAFQILLTSLGTDLAGLARSKGPEGIADILLYHVATPKLMSTELRNGMMLQTLQGGRLFVQIKSSAVSIGESKVAKADISCSNGIIHVIDAVLLHPAKRMLAGGPVDWRTSGWNVRTDNVMGGRSSGSVKFDAGTMIFTGSINLNGGGFSSVGMNANLDLSDYAGIFIETGTVLYSTRMSPLGLQVSLTDQSGYRFGAPVALPVAAAQTRHRIFLPFSEFDSAGRSGRKCANCVLDRSTVRSVDFYVLYQSGPFEVQVHEVSALKRLQDGPGAPTAITLPALQTTGVVSQLLEATISGGVKVYNSGYPGLCEVMYASAMRSILATESAPAAARGVACATLGALTGSRSDKAWILRLGIDTILADQTGSGRPSSMNYGSAAGADWVPAQGAASEIVSETCLWMLAGHSGASSSGNAMAAPAPDPAPVTTSGMSDFLGPFVAMGITGYNDFDLRRVSSPTECAELCRANAKCNSFDYGARGQVLGECWMSMATRQSAGSAFSRWELYDYYERRSENTLGVRGGMASASKTEPPKKDDPNVLMFALIGALVVISGLIFIIACLVVRRRRSCTTASPASVGELHGTVVVGNPIFQVPGSKSDTKWSEDSSTVVNGQPVSMVRQRSSGGDIVVEELS